MVSKSARHRGRNLLMERGVLRLKGAGLATEMELYVESSSSDRGVVVQVHSIVYLAID